jgi:hypothetical protein
LTFNMVRWMRWPAAAGLLLSAAMSTQAADVDATVSIGIHQPGLYGRIDIGRYPQPQLIVQRPVVIYQQAQAPQPIYLRVPPGHRQNWRKHCRAYGACGTPVYFVQERWYQDHVVRAAPRQGDRDGRQDDRRDDRRDHRQDDRQDDRRHDKGNGKGRGHD